MRKFTMTYKASIIFPLDSANLDHDIYWSKFWGWE